VGSQSSLIMKMAFTGWSDSHYEAKKLREVERMRREMKSKGDESTKRMLGMLMSSQGEALLKAVFSSWHETAVESHIARMRDDMAHMKSKKEQGTQKMLAMLLGSQAELMQKAMFTGWHELVAVLKKDRETERMKAAMKAKGDESSKRMLAMLMGSQQDVLRKASFAGWWEHVAEIKKENAVKQMQQDMRAKGAESSKRMLGMLIGAQAETLMKMTFACWSDWVVSVRIERMREQSSKARSKEQESQRRMLSMLMGSQGSLLVRTSFSGWSELAYQSKKLREVEQMRRNMKSKGDESSKRMLGMLMSSQGEALLKAVFSSWHETAVESHIQRMRDDMAHMKSKKEQGTQKMLAMLLGSQAELMQKAMFTAWHELVAVMKKDRETERMKAAMKAKGDESSKRMLGMLMGSQAEVLLKAAFSGWWELVSHVIQERHIAELKNGMSSKNEESSKRMIAMLMGARTEGLIKMSFGAWKDIVGELRTQRMREENMRMRGKKDEGQKRMLAMLVGSQGNLIVKTSFAGWQELVAALKQEREVERIKSKGDVQKNRMLAMLMGGQEHSLLKAVFAGWLELYLESKNQREVNRLTSQLKAKQDKSSKSMMRMLMGSQGNTVVKTTFNSWRDYYHEQKAHKQVSEMQKMMRSKGSESVKRMMGNMLNNQAGALLRNTFKTWAEIVANDKMKRMREQYQSMRSRGDESKRRMLGMLLGSHDGALLKGCFSAWHEIVMKVKNEREVERLQSGMKAKGSEQTKRMLGMLIGSQGETLLKASLSGWLELTMVSKQAREMEALKRSMKDTQAKKMLGMVMSSQGAALHKNAFTAWREFVKEEKQERAMDEMRQHMMSKKNGSNKQIMGVLMGSQNSGLLRGSFTHWWNHVEDTRKARLKEEMAKMKSKSDESKRRMLSALMGSQGSLMMKATFSVWQEQVATLRQERSMHDMKAGLKAENNKRLLTMLMGNQAEVIMKAGFAGWREVVLEVRQQKELDDLQHAMKDANTKKMMGLLASSQSGNLLRLVFSGWRENTIESKREREIDQFVNAMGEKSETTTKRMLAMLLHSQGETMLKASLTAWRDYVREIQQQRQSAQTREMQASLKTKKDETTKRMLQMLLGSQSSFLLKSTFAAWRDLRTSTLSTSQLEELRAAHLKIKMRVSARSKTLIAKMFGSQLSLLLLSSFVNWRDMINSFKRENELVRLREANMVNALKSKSCAKKAFVALAGTKTDILLKTVFAAWRESFREVQVELQIQKLKEENMRMMLAVCEQETDIARMREQSFTAEAKNDRNNSKLMEDIMQLKMKGTHESRRFITQLFGAQGWMLLKAAFTAWHELEMRTVMQKDRAELTRLRTMFDGVKGRKSESAERLVVKMLGSESKGLLKVVIGAWRELFSEFRSDVEHAQLKEENLRMMLAVCEQESEMTRLKEEVCRLMEENLESAKECRRLREESLHYAQQCRHLITSGGGEPTMLPRVAALTHLLSTAHEPLGEGAEVQSPSGRSRSPGGRAGPGPLAHLLSQVDTHATHTTTHREVIVQNTTRGRFGQGRPTR